MLTAYINATEDIAVQKPKKVTVAPFFDSQIVYLQFSGRRES